MIKELANICLVIILICIIILGILAITLLLIFAIQKTKCSLDDMHNRRRNNER